MPKKLIIPIIALSLVLIAIGILVLRRPMGIDTAARNTFQSENEIILPQPRHESPVSIEEALLRRRSVRRYIDEPLNLQEISQILWAAQGVTAPEFGGRTAPSAGALYPLELYLVVRRAEGIQPGGYRYLPKNHSLVPVLKGEVSNRLARAALGQMFISEAPIALVFSGVYERATARYGERGIRYVHMEVGHAAQNVHLQVVSLGLGTVVVGAFIDEEVKEILNMPREERPLYIMPIGRMR